MKQRNEVKNRVVINPILLIASFLFFCVIILQMMQLSLSTKIDGINLGEFASNRNTKKETLYATRGSIYTSNGDVLAQNIDTYTVIAYLSSKRTTNIEKPKHVVDKDKTATLLSPILNMTKESILTLLNKENLYQVELRPGGQNITELTKEEIEKLQLPGIDFIQTFKRYYPNNDFLSYTLGYVQTKDDYKLVGEMGLEKYYNKYLSGKDGYLEYQKDINGYKIPNTPEIKEEQVDGADIYLTIDDNIQMFTERVVKNASEEYKPEWMLLAVVEAKTGKILGTSSYPSFNPNVRNITSYLNPLVSYAYEPGSTIKTYSYMAAMEKGTYKGSDTFKSGNITIADATISDWNNKGWGTINYDQGFALSSNVGAASMINNFINKNDLKSYLQKLGFGKSTEFTLPNEVSGKLDIKYEVEVANATFGQGFTVTPIQHIQALTPIANNGMMLKPYIVEKIVDPTTNNIIYQGAKEEKGIVATSDTITKIKELMYNTINGETSMSTGYVYKVDGYDVIGKTGTAQYVDPKTGKYQTGSEEYLRSFAGMFPKDDPQIIIYGVAKHPQYGGVRILSTSIKQLINDTGKYLNISSSKDNTNLNNKIIMPNLYNKNISELKNINHNNIYIIGDGNIIINQYPDNNINIYNNEKIFILTNSNNIIIPNMINWSLREVKTYCNLINIKCNMEGYGFVESQSISPNTNIKDIKNIDFIFKRTTNKVSIEEKIIE